MTGKVGANQWIVRVYVGLLKVYWFNLISELLDSNEYYVCEQEVSGLGGVEQCTKKMNEWGEKIIWQDNNEPRAESN